jgi:hypothetical protein
MSSHFHPMSSHFRQNMEKPPPPEKGQFFVVLFTEYIIGGAPQLKEIEWWLHRLAEDGDIWLPLASRSDFPSSDDSVLSHYCDASREEGKPLESGGAAWTVINDTFLFIERRWTEHEVLSFSINVLEAVFKDAGSYAFFAYSKAMGMGHSHSLVFTDNTTAENVAESARTSSDALNELNKVRQQWLADNKISQASERVASVDNDIADELSRGAIKQALRFPRAYGLRIVRLDPEGRFSDTSHLTPTWPL